jgi:hypothetical protein
MRHDCGARTRRPTGGPLVLIETAGTCVDEPTPPSDLVALYELWESLGFEWTDYPSDYRFESVEVASKTMGAFFGPEMSAQLTRRDGARVPEFTRVFTRSR